MRRAEDCRLRAEEAEERAKEAREPEAKKISSKRLEGGERLPSKWSDQSLLLVRTDRIEPEGLGGEMRPRCGASNRYLPSTITGGPFGATRVGIGGRAERGSLLNGSSMRRRALDARRQTCALPGLSPSRKPLPIDTLVGNARC
jgi:hypothetical protein